MTKTIDFEKSLKRLERIVKDLEDGNISLDESLKKYEEGIELARDCSKSLKEAKTRVEKLVKKQGIEVAEEFSPQGEDDDVS